VLGEPGIGAGFEAAKGQQAHGLDSAGHHHSVAAGADAVIGQDNGFEPGGAEAVDGDARNFDRQLCAQSGKASDIPALFALRLGAAEDGRRRPRLCRGPRLGARLRSTQLRLDRRGGWSRERPWGRGPPGANGADDNGFRHGKCSFANLLACLRTITPASAARSRHSSSKSDKRSCGRRANRPGRRGRGKPSGAPGPTAPGNLLGRGRVNAPVEAENAAWVVGLQALGFGAAASTRSLPGALEK